MAGDINSEFRVSHLLRTNSSMVQLWQNIMLAITVHFLLWSNFYTAVLVRKATCTWKYHKTQQQTTQKNNANGEHTLTAHKVVDLVVNTSVIALFKLLVSNWPSIWNYVYYKNSCYLI